MLHIAEALEAVQQEALSQAHAQAQAPAQASAQAQHLPGPSDAYDDSIDTLADPGLRNELQLLQESSSSVSATGSVAGARVTDHSMSHGHVELVESMDRGLAPELAAAVAAVQDIYTHQHASLHEAIEQNLVDAKEHTHRNASEGESAHVGYIEGMDGIESRETETHVHRAAGDEGQSTEDVHVVYEMLQAPTLPEPAGQRLPVDSDPGSAGTDSVRMLGVPLDMLTGQGPDSMAMDIVS
jgi:hypothetical protein